jgi:hypothetical protein
MVPREKLACLEEEVQEVMLVKTVKKDPLDHRDHQAAAENHSLVKEKRERQENKVNLDVKADLDHKVNLVHLVHQVLLVKMVETEKMEKTDLPLHCQMVLSLLA